MAGRVPKRFRRPVEREIANSSFMDICCAVIGVLILLALIFGGIHGIYDYLFFTPVEVYYGNVSADVPQDLEYFQIPIKYKPNSTIYVTGFDIHSDTNINDTVITDENGLGIYTADIAFVDDEISYTFTSEDTHKEQDFLICKSEYNTGCTVNDGSYRDLDHADEIKSYPVSPILK